MKIFTNSTNNKDENLKAQLELCKMQPDADTKQEKQREIFELKCNNCVTEISKLPNKYTQASKTFQLTFSKYLKDHLKRID